MKGGTIGLRQIEAALHQEAEYPGNTRQDAAQSLASPFPDASNKNGNMLDNIVPACPDNAPLWAECIRIYIAGFPRWERESERTLRKRTMEGRYRVMAGLEDGKVAGIAILDIEPPHQWGLLPYLVIDETCRGKGYGTQLTEQAIEIFLRDTDCNWLLIEAEDRQAALYGRIGFRKIEVDFLVPSFEDDSVVPMHLLAIGRDRKRTQLSVTELRDMLEWIYVSGYLLDRNDPRFIRQINAVQRDGKLVRWPPDRHDQGDGKTDPQP